MGKIIAFADKFGNVTFVDRIRGKTTEKSRGGSFAPNPFGPVVINDAGKKEIAHQQELANRQTNPLARPDFAMGVNHRLSNQMKDYIAAYGQEFKGGPVPPGIVITASEMGECYKNASLAVIANPELTYVEGFATTANVPELPFLHAWTVDKDNNVIDPTWGDSSKNKYFGVKYDTAKYIPYLHKAKLYGVLGSTEKNALSAITTGGRALRSDDIANFDWNEADHPRGKTTDRSSGGSFAPKEGGEQQKRVSILNQPSSAYPKANNAVTLLDDKDIGIDSMTVFTRPDGTFTPERQALHDAIVAEALAGHKAPLGEAIVNVMGGGGASGKSSILERLNMPTDHVLLDVDAIRVKLPEWGEELAAAKAEGRAPKTFLSTFTHEEASHIGKRIIDGASQAGYNLLVDGVGDSGIDKLTNNIKRYTQGGQKVHANYVTVDYDLAYQRMRARGDKIGRYIPARYLREMHAEVSKIFPVAVAKGLFHEHNLWDTSGPKPIKIASGKGKQVTVHDEALYQKFLDKGKGIEPKPGEI